MQTNISQADNCHLGALQGPRRETRTLLFLGCTVSPQNGTTRHVPKVPWSVGKLPLPNCPMLTTPYSSLSIAIIKTLTFTCVFWNITFFSISPKPLPHPEWLGSLSRALSNVTTTKDSMTSVISAPQWIKKTSLVIYCTGLGWFPLHPISKWNVLPSANKSS